MASAMTLIASAIGGAIKSKGASKAAEQNRQAQEKAARYALDMSSPYSVSGSLGGASFDNEGRQLNLTLSKDLQTQQDAMLSSATANRNYLQGLESDPLSAENRYYEQQMALLRPEQAEQREALDAQLVARGMLGSTGGMGQAQALREAQGTTNLQARFSASDRVQNLIDKYRARISGDVSDAITLGQQPVTYAGLGIETGGMLRPAAMLGSQYLSGAGLTSANATMGKYGGIGDAISSFKKYTPNSSYNPMAQPKGTLFQSAAAATATDKQYQRNII